MLDFSKIQTILQGDTDRSGKLYQICRLLRTSVSYYHWVGFYLNSSSDHELILGPYDGAETEHRQIPFGQGICGQVALSHETLLVQDITVQDNYLTCDLAVQSEIVIPIMKNKQFIGELDIDSHLSHPFQKSDKIQLEQLCHLIAETLF
jgi:GAF domain-containing protein